MSKLNNPTVMVATKDGDNPYRKGTFKQVLFAWALKKGQFTKEEFLKAHNELREEYEVQSKMSPDVAAKAWFNEFYSKAKTFVDVQA